MGYLSEGKVTATCFPIDHRWWAIPKCMKRRCRKNCLSVGKTGVDFLSGGNAGTVEDYLSEDGARISASQLQAEQVVDYLSAGRFGCRLPVCRNRACEHVKYSKLRVCTCYMHITVLLYVD